MVDSSVIVTSLLEQEKEHKRAKAFLNLSHSPITYSFLAPISVVVEVTAAIARRTRSNQLALEVRDNLLGLPFFSFYELTRSRGLTASEIAAQCKVTGMDALVIQVASEFQVPLLTLDQEMATRARPLVLIKHLQDLVP